MSTLGVNELVVSAITAGVIDTYRRYFVVVSEEGGGFYIQPPGLVRFFGPGQLLYLLHTQQSLVRLILLVLC